MTISHAAPTRGWLRIPGGLVLLAFLTIAAFFLVTEHRAHLRGVLPYVLLFLHTRALSRFGPRVRQEAEE